MMTKCRCCHPMLLDSGLLCASTAGEVKLMLGEFRRFVEEYILSYSNAINSWLNEEPPKGGWLKDARYVSENGSLEIVEDIRSSLGERDEVKEWLAACLLKTVPYRRLSVELLYQRRNIGDILWSSSNGR